MLDITSHPTNVLGPVKAAGLQTLPPGQVFISADAAGTSDLSGGQKVVLETTSGGPLELLASKTAPPVTEAGTYLDVSDLGKLGSAKDGPTLRTYGWRDTWRKVRSRAGVQVGVGALATLITAAIGLLVAFTATNPSSTIDVSKVKTVLAWSREPLDQLKTSPAPSASELDASRRTIDARITTGGDCLSLLQGDQAPAATVPGVTCTKSSGSDWSTNTAAGVVTAAIAVLIAILGALALTNKYGFQQSPS